MTGEAYAQSARIARDHGGPFSGYEKNREPFLRVMRKHRDSMRDVNARNVPSDLYQTAKSSWDDAVEIGEEHGYRNAQVTVLAPITQDLLSSLVTGLGDVNYVPLKESSLVVVPGQTHKSHIPAARNSLDFPLTGFYPIEVSTWDSPNARRQLVLTVSTRISAVLGTVFQGKLFQKLDWAEAELEGFLVVGVLFFIVELASLRAGVKLSRSITGAVHEIYEGTQHVKEGDFSYRIPVKGNDQLAELGNSFALFGDL